MSNQELFSQGGGGLHWTCFENHGNDSRVIEVGDMCPTITRRAGTGGGNLPLVMAHGQANAEIRSDGSPSLTCNHEAPMQAVAFEWQSGVGVNPSPECSGTLIKNQVMGLYQGSIVRRLTPTECERLQGFPDGYTLVPFKGKPATDGHRYKSLGNSMAVPVIRWLGERIQVVGQMNLFKE